VRSNRWRVTKPQLVMTGRALFRWPDTKAETERQNAAAARAEAASSAASLESVRAEAAISRAAAEAAAAEATQAAVSAANELADSADQSAKQLADSADIAAKQLAESADHVAAATADAEQLRADLATATDAEQRATEYIQVGPDSYFPPRHRHRHTFKTHRLLRCTASCYEASNICQAH